VTVITGGGLLLAACEKIVDVTTFVNLHRARIAMRDCAW